MQRAMAMAEVSCVRGLLRAVCCLCYHADSVRSMHVFLIAMVGPKALYQLDALPTSHAQQLDSFSLFNCSVIRM
jgi:hypothetical protein